MSRAPGSHRLPVIVTIIVAFVLTIVPMPAWAEAFRPDWVMLTLIYWAMMLPRTWSVGSAWIVGLMLDVAQGTMLGQHSLALCFVVFMTVRFHLLMRVFPMQQLAATIFALLALYQFILFWINGVAGIEVPARSYWGPVIASTIAWPFATAFLRGVRLSTQLSR